MIKRITVLMLIFFSLLPLSNVYSKQEERVVAIGDSIPFGYNLSKDNHMPPSKAFPYLIGEETGLEVTNLSVPGLTSGELLKAVHSNDMFRQSIQGADYVILYIGGNDLLNLVKKNKDLDGIRIEEAAPVIRDLIYNVYSTIVLIDQLTDGEILVYNIYNPYPSAGAQLNTPLAYINQQYAALIKLLSHFTSVKLLNANLAFKGHPENIIKGDVHPTEEGQRVLAKLALQQMKK
ncbi:SGNH/GDSL hydrolase family protein [Halobacillus sp. K22]|uniref:SGNH/GDSL hydrolase family protein n=1 Tax=Halobacillus sp. K22 TaxID=3457431 RepID=UPI003FCC8680